MGRLNSMTLGGNAVATATYGVAGELATLWSSNFGTETRTYNSLFQLTRQTVSGPSGTQMDTEYRYPSGQNNGRITQAVDWMSGEEVTYAYDALQRLAKAETTGPQWGQAYTYDGFGNLSEKQWLKGSATTLSLMVDPATNRPYGTTYDANGNAAIGTWDVENRLVLRFEGQVPMQYDPAGKRVMQYKVVHYDVGDLPTWTISLYDQAGQRAGDVKCIRYDLNNYNCSGTPEPTFAGRRLAITDRLGSTRSALVAGAWTRSSYYPYGEEKDPGGAEGTVRFGTYVRDSMGAGIDYADQRYYSPQMGRFLSPDPYRGSGTVRIPQSWNRYLYVEGDPTNNNDPDGLCVIKGKEYQDGSPPCPDTVSITVSADSPDFGYYSNWGVVRPRYGLGSDSEDPVLLDRPVGFRRGSAEPSESQDGAERLERLKNCAVGYYGLDDLNLATISSVSEWAGIVAVAGGVPKSIPEGLGWVRRIRQPRSSDYTSILSIISALDGGGGWLRTIANFGSRWAGPIAVAAAAVDATAIGICAASGESSNRAR
jgi:RHS repeat-associated protein